MAQTSIAIAAKAIAAQLDRPASPTDMARRIAAFLVENRSVKDMSKLMRLLETMRTKRGLVEAVVSSAHTIEPGQRSQIERIIRAHLPEAKSIVYVDRIDPQLVGGVRVLVAGKEFDVTVRDKLNRLKHL